MFQTKEVARNETPDIQVKCAKCKKQFSIVTALQEILVSVGYSAVVEGVFICPHCACKKHIYYMTEHLRNEQRLLQEYAMEWQHTQSDRAFMQLRAKKLAYRNEYDRIQEKYAKEFGNGSDKK